MKIAKLLSFAGSMTFFFKASSFSMSPQPPLYQIIRGEYQDKIRRYSPLQKVFGVFASKNQNGQYVLTINDLLKALCFYNYSQSTNEHLQNFNAEKIKKFLGKQSDFEIYDYFNFIMFLKLTPKSLRKFMLDNNLQEINKSGFNKLMLECISTGYDTFIKSSIGIQSRQYKPDKHQFLKSILRIADSMFQSKDYYSPTEFIQFKKGVMKELYAYQFKSFSLNQNTIDGVQFARSILKYAQNNNKRKLLRQANRIQKDIQSIRITEKEYVDFHFELQTNIQKINSLLSARGVVTRDEILNILNEKDTKISKSQIQIVFRLLDTDNSGFVEKRQFLGVVQSLGYYWTSQPQTSLKQIAKQRWIHFQNKARKIQQILMEQ